MDGNSKGIIQLGLKKKINKKKPPLKRGGFLFSDIRTNRLV